MDGELFDRFMAAFDRRRNETLATALENEAKHQAKAPRPRPQLVWSSFEERECNDMPANRRRARLRSVK